MKTARDKWLVCLFPALLTAIVYIFFISGSAMHSLSEARNQLQKSREEASPDLLAGRATLAALNVRLDREKNRSTEFKSALLKMPGVESTPAPPASVLKMIDDLLSSRKLILLKSTRVADGDGKKLPAQTESLSKRLTEQAVLPRAEFWQLEIDGDYPNMLDALQAIRRSGTFIVPVSISMEPSKSGDGALRWLLTVWI